MTRVRHIKDNNHPIGAGLAAQYAICRMVYAMWSCDAGVLGRATAEPHGEMQFTKCSSAILSAGTACACACIHHEGKTGRRHRWLNSVSTQRKHSAGA
eukprot:CAMPEP_0181212884 /NCGR_PEP_ID=MMETSP1096-20121128/24602_1 /TAXON_ID=156174 ORGANISM="Chrysochromulina ericina, Strain CCMP281" /NCGR_SAMPLE_ID=MMETSP1096 /ASSEMBLY_ACC=CAM_ASM_000453 /LENGTH=97 /DNA_ID=CAMNT_0023304471 /DNA_START=264 /DNA_END=554 /DNA_ORIENTATION=+